MSDSVPTPQAVCFGLSGVVLRDNALQYQLTSEVIQNWGIVFKPGEYRELCLGCSETTGLHRILERRGRAVNESIVQELLQRKYQLYRDRFSRENLMMPGLSKTLQQLQEHNIPCVLVSDTPLSEVQWRLEQAGLREYFTSLATSHRLALTELQVTDWYSCLAVESTYSAIESAQALGLTVIALATRHPFHMLHRRADWVVDNFAQLDQELNHIFEVSQATLPL